MRNAARTVAISTPALVVVAVAWLRLEQPVGSLWPVLALLALALAAALPSQRWLRANPVGSALQDFRETFRPQSAARDTRAWS